MVLTQQILKQNNACQDGIDFFNNFFTEPIELIEVIKDKRVPREFLDWGMENLSTSDEEKDMYYKVMNVKDSKSIYLCKDVYNSEYISNSEDIKNCKFVWRSQSISDSSEVGYSKEVENSSYIYKSNFVVKSNRILSSINCSDSNNIVNSNYIMGSSNVYDNSKIIHNSNVIKNCSNIENCRFCADSSNLTNSLFCSHMSGEYFLFNQPCNKDIYTFIIKQFDKYFGNVNLNLMRDTKSVYGGLIEIKNISLYFTDVPKTFWEWIRTLPNYDPMFIYTMTYIPDFLFEVSK